ncbi:MAG: hypothetical protein JSV03_01310 [Planctomycetota bacterium]|nr:MAG: hypothetical protein JSV03_01310 [Planctomycetota bacterium]
MRKIIVLTLCVTMLGIVSSAGAAVDSYFTNGTGNGKAYTSGNWTLWPIKNNIAHVGTADYNNMAATVDVRGNPQENIQQLHVGHGGTGVVIINNSGRIRPWNRCTIGADLEGNAGDGTIDVQKGSLVTRNGAMLAGSETGYFTLWPGLMVGGDPLSGEADSGGNGLLRISAGDTWVDIRSNKDLLVGIGTGTGLSNGTVTLDPGINPGWGMNVSHGAYLGVSANSAGTLNIASGTVTIAWNSLNAFDVGGYGNGLVNMTGGYLHVVGAINLARYAGSTGHIQLDGGIIETDLHFVERAGNGTMDIAGGEFIIPNNRTGAINSYIASGVITGYGNVGAGNLNIFDDGSDLHVTGIPPLEVDVDILPDDDPNLLTVNTQGKGRLPIAILGSEEYDINEIDLDTISIAGLVIPVKAKVGDDVSGDGLADLTVHVSRRDLILALGLDIMEPGTAVPITIDCNLLNGRTVFGTDNVELVARED